MCGIFGVISKEKFSSSEVLKALKRLEYRGYDSFGITTDSGLFEKHVGEIKIGEGNECNIAISHCRWATHGKINEANAHPHHDCTKTIFVVHNGIIENYQDMKAELSSHKFYSETDTEVIAHYFEEKLKSKSVESAIQDFFADAKGTFGIVLFIKDAEKLYTLKRDSPIVIGTGKNVFYTASDPYAFSDKTGECVFLEDDEYAVLTKEGFRLFDRHGREIFREKVSIPEQHAATKNGYDHYMLKEIKEQPQAMKNLLDNLDVDNFAKAMKGKKVVFVASGTSYHASLIGVYFLKKAGIEAQTIIASEFRDYSSVDSNSLVIAVSQSGETMDVIDAIKHAKQQGAAIASIVNVQHSTLERMSQLSLNIQAGQEIAVASTKAFTNQILLMLALANRLGYSTDLEKIVKEAEQVFALENRILDLAESLVHEKDIYIIGRGLSYPVSREIALKLKEIAYVHAEGMMGGELKHGTLALIENGTPVIALVDSNEAIVSNVKEAEARGARIIAITNRKEKNFEEELRIETESGASFALCATIVGQLLTYHLAKKKDLPIDKPRNLAKSVTVK